jgi:hypothetical protein
MSFITEYDTYRVTVSLNINTIFISMMNINNYNIYEKEISSLDFNNDKFTIKNLYNIFEDAFIKRNKEICMNLELHDKIIKININILSPYMNFTHKFEIYEKKDDNIHLRELKKELDFVKKKNDKLESLLLNRNIKTNSIISLVNIDIDEDQVEKEYKWFLEWFAKLMETHKSQPEKYPNILYDLPDEQVGNINTHSVFLKYGFIIGSTNVHTSHGTYTSAISKSIPPKNLYYYLKKRNIEIWAIYDSNQHTGGYYTYTT